MESGANKLFHVLVVVGASMTSVNCGGVVSEGPVDPDAARDAALDGARRSDAYDGIAPARCGDFVACDDAAADAYVHIAPDVKDSGKDDDAYVHIAADAGDAYVHIAPDVKDTGAADVYTGISPVIEAGPDGYATISPPPPPSDPNDP